METIASHGRGSVAKRLARWTAISSILLLALLPATAVAAETPFDLSAAINACPVGGTVTVPAGTFTVTSTLTPKSGITIQGSGADTVIYRPDPHSGDPTIITIMDKSNITIKNLTLASNDYGVTSTMRGMELGGATNITIDGVMLRGLSNGIVASNNGDKDNSNLTITRCSSVDVYQPMFIRTTHNSTFSYLDLHAMEDRDAGEVLDPAAPHLHMQQQ